jgi:ABC-type multidrug transport system ATPase subunit
MSDNSVMLDSVSTPGQESGHAPPGILSAAGLSAGYQGSPVLHDVVVDYGPGLHVLLGPNGAGKTTFFRVLAGVLPPIKGEVLVNGRNPHTDAAAKALVGVAAHRAALASRLSVADNLRYWARVLALPGDQREDLVRRVVGQLGLADIAGRRAGTLSRGQQQRAGLAKALLGDPPVLLLDEPTAGIDPAAASRLRGQLHDLAAAGRVVVLSSHNLDEASELADDVTILHQGRIVGRGDAAALRTQLVGDAYRLRLGGSGEMGAALAALGYPAEPAAHGFVVEVADRRAAEVLVSKLVQAGVGIHEVTPVGNALEDVYMHLDGTR